MRNLKLQSIISLSNINPKLYDKTAGPGPVTLYNQTPTVKHAYKTWTRPAKPNGRVSGLQWLEYIEASFIVHKRVGETAENGDFEVVECVH